MVIWAEGYNQGRHGAHIRQGRNEWAEKGVAEDFWDTSWVITPYTTHRHKDILICRHGAIKTQRHRDIQIQRHRDVQT